MQPYAFPKYAFPEYAPLPASFVFAALNTDSNTFLRLIQQMDEAFFRHLESFEARFIEERERLSSLMKDAFTEGNLTIGWFRSQVAAEMQLPALGLPIGERLFDASPRQTISRDQKGHKEVSRQTILQWRKGGWLPREELDYDRFAAILILIALQRQQRRNLPKEPVPDEPSYHCYRLDHPNDQWQPCPVPLPEILPVSTLLWTPHRTLRRDWLVTEEGSLRWGKCDKQGRWLIPTSALKEWNPLFGSANAALLDMPGIGIDARHEFANGTLRLLSMPDYEDRPFTFPLSPMDKRRRETKENAHESKDE